MSEFVNNALGKSVRGLDVSPQFAGFSGVEIIVDEETSFFSGDLTGRVLTIENPWGSQAQANNILASIQGFQYQPFSATGAMLSPAAEIGDGVTVNGFYSGIYKLSKIFTDLMTADVEAPEDEEIDHEYPYEPKQDRIYRREIAAAMAQIGISQDAITAEVLRATDAENTLSSKITQTANSITASVVSKTGGSNASFGWSLLSNKFSLFAGNKEVFKCNSAGVTIDGTIKASSGTIGGFTIGKSAIYNTMDNINSNAKGIYMGTNGIAVGGGAFKVTSNGAVSANNMTLTGTLTIGGQTITAAALRSGAQSAYSNGGYWSAGAAYGNNYNNATKQGSGAYPDYFRAINLVGDYLSTTHTFVCPGLQVGGTLASWKTATISGVTIHYLGY